MSVYKQRNGKGWTIDYTVNGKRMRETVNVCDKVLAERILGQRREQAHKVNDGLADPFLDHNKRLLSEHVADWEASCEGTEKYVCDSVRMVRQIFADCRMTKWSHVRLSSVQKWVKDHKAANRGGTSARNHYVEAVTRFARWMLADERTPRNPLLKLKQDRMGERADRRHVRRAFTDDELGRLLDAARTGPHQSGMTGPDRAMLYQLAFETGLRSSECRGMTRFAFDLNPSRPTFTVAAGLAGNKAKQTATLPLRRAFAAELKAWFDGRDASGPMFTMPHLDSVARMLRRDEKAAGIEYKDAQGRVADFHALRHTFCTRLARSGVQPARMRLLARHANIQMTMDYYVHVHLDELAVDVESIPDVRAQTRKEIKTVL